MALKSDKYFTIIDRSNDTSELARYSSVLWVLVNPPMFKKHKLSIYLAKNGNPNKNEADTKSNEYSIVKPASKEDFYQAYYYCLKYLHQFDTTKGSYYLLKYFEKEPNGIVWFSADQNNKQCIRITIDNEPTGFYIGIEYINNWQGIQHFRRANHSISPKEFNQIFKHILNYVHSPESYSDNYKQLATHFGNLANGEQLKMEIESSWQVDNRLVIEKISNRVEAIQRRLIEIDTDTAEERMKMRGELEGLKYSLNVLLYN